MNWRLALSLNKLRDQINEMFPKRNKDWDGTIGDESHQTRDSDHNAWVKDHSGQPIVTAIDLTHDPKNGFDTYAFAEFLMAKKDPRIKYVISNRRIGSGDAGPSPWMFRKYTGKNPHDHHIHISVKADEGHFDAVSDWALGGFAAYPENVNLYEAPMPKTKKGDTGKYVILLQTKLQLPQTGTFDDATFYAVKGWQLAKGLTADSIVGPQTWKSLG